MTVQAKLVPCLWFDDQAEQAAHHYVSIFPDSRILSVTRYTEVGPGPKDSVMVVNFQLAGQQITALNGGPIFKFSEAVSLQIMCETQDEVDHYWGKLSAGGHESQCGWLKDKFGFSWQVVPLSLTRLLESGDAAKSDRMLKAMFPMKKLDIAMLEHAYNG